ncbi:MAG TPA: 6-phosphogluconolactonase [Candidatus Omnitrophota bacterium]|nr:6-phosphogluconolactonase [Candidatus Omnitrophota bacterium]
MLKEKKILIFENPFILVNRLVKEFVRIAELAIREKGAFYVALTGGKSSIPFYSRLTAVKDYAFWRQTHIFLTDERFVPLTDSRSNFRMIKETLLNDLFVPENNIHPIGTQYDNAFFSAKNYEKNLNKILPISNEYPQFDFILLSLGEDGHIASLFPGRKDFKDSHSSVVTTYLEEHKMDRISLSLAVLNNAKYVIGLAIGKKKRKALQCIMEKDKNIPVAQLDLYGGQLCFWADQEAAQCLKARDWNFIDKDSFSVNL